MSLNVILQESEPTKEVCQFYEENQYLDKANKTTLCNEVVLYFFNKNIPLEKTKLSKLADEICQKFGQDKVSY